MKLGIQKWWNSKDFKTLAFGIPIHAPTITSRKSSKKTGPITWAPDFSIPFLKILGVLRIMSYTWAENGELSLFFPPDSLVLKVLALRMSDRLIAHLSLFLSCFSREGLEKPTINKISLTLSFPKEDRTIYSCGPKIFIWMVQAMVKLKSQIVQLNFLNSYLRNFSNNPAS